MKSYQLPPPQARLRLLSPPPSPHLSPPPGLHPSIQAPTRVKREGEAPGHDQEGKQRAAQGPRIGQVPHSIVAHCSGGGDTRVMAVHAKCVQGRKRAYNGTIAAECKCSV
jgi:hypothetical protein